MANKEKLEEKIGEALGLEKAAQVAVEELSAKGLLDEGGMKDKLQTMKKQANIHQTNIEGFVRALSESEGLSSGNIQETAQETQQKVSEMMKTYLGEDPDSSEAIEFLCLAEGGEVTHYEVLSALTKGVKNKKFGTKVKAILAEEKKHLQLCIRLAKQTAAGS
jgi:ferritin-like protein